MQTTTHIVATPDGSLPRRHSNQQVGAQRYIDKSWRLR